MFKEPSPSRKSPPPSVKRYKLKIPTNKFIQRANWNKSPLFIKPLIR